MWCRAGKPASITHCSRLRRAGGSPGWFPLRNTRRWKRGDFIFFNHSFSVIVFWRARFTPCCFTEVGKCRGACHRKSSRGIGLAMSWLLKPPAMGKTLKRRCVGNRQSPGYLLLLSSTQITRGCWGTRRFKMATHGSGGAHPPPVWLGSGAVPGFLRLQRQQD